MPRGAPVNIVPRGGFPVKEMTSGAPLLSEAPSGKGAPITLNAKGTPFIIERRRTESGSIV